MIAGLCLVTLLVLAGAAAGVIHVEVTRNGGSEDPKKLAEEFGVPGKTVQRWEPPTAIGSGVSLAIGDLGQGGPCILSHGAGQGGGGPCFTSGWAVEAGSVPADNGVLYLGMTVPRAATVHFGRSRDALQTPAWNVPGHPKERYFALYVPGEGLPKLKFNDITAYDDRGRLLGGQHANDGHGGFGPWTGLIDSKRRP